MLMVLTDVVMCIKREFPSEVLLTVSQSIVGLLMSDLQMIWIVLHQMLGRGVSFTVCICELVFLSNHIFTLCSLVLVRSL